ncbi:MAG: 4-alpha-glucanotransferase [Lachnospiraceae bacterium]|nr:4-alpha-glucanotransferase [Lachnospiraceae bacterium]
MRKSGILMHISSLPGPYGIGTFGKYAYDFIDFLHAGGQAYWQLLPLSPTGYGDSPYQSFSTFAGNPYFIDPELLIGQALLTGKEIQFFRWFDEEEKVDFGCLYRNRPKVLKQAFQRFSPDANYRKFLNDNADWLPDYALFMALKEHFNGCCWQDWPEEFRLRRPETLEQYRQTSAGEIEFQYFLQYEFYLQWTNLRRYASEKGIRIIGDVPIYVPLDSADVWSNYQLFQLDDHRRPARVAGCPPDSFSANGQLWGNPLYDWNKIHETGYEWWIRRLKAAAQRYDVIRLDHFRGFEGYWSVPADESTAINGKWAPGPGREFIQTIQQALPDTEFIAEDLGFLTPEVKQLQQDSGWPGMKVIQFAFDSREAGDYLPHLYPVNSVCYSGTHDNLTLKQWFSDAAPKDVQSAKAYLGLHREEGLVWGMIRGCMGSVSRLCIIQMQDYLELGKEARMNTPGLLSKQNWTWRAGADMFSDRLAQKIRTITERYGRL